MTSSQLPPSSSPSFAPEAIFIPIDLEASLGHLGSTENDEQQQQQRPQQQEMDCGDDQHVPVPQQHNTRTSSRTPFPSTPDDNSNIAPYAITESEEEIQERERLSGVVGIELFTPHNNINNAITTLLAMDDNSMMAVTATDSPLEEDDDDCFSLGACDEEDLQQEDLQQLWSYTTNPANFFEDVTAFKALQQQGDQGDNNIPLAVSFSASTMDLSSMDL